MDDATDNDIIFSINDQAKSAVSNGSQFIEENETSELNIGMKFNPSQSSFVATQYLNAYIYELKVYNVAKDSAQSTAYVLPGTQCNGDCSFCPTDGECINTCLLDFYADGDNCV